jgi:hypothetical protein
MDGEVLHENIFQLLRTMAARLIINSKTYTLGFCETESNYQKGRSRIEAIEWY